MNIEEKKQTELLVEEFKAKTDSVTEESKTKDRYKFAYRNNLARLFYDFLSGKSDNFPSFKYVDAVIRKNDSDDFIISVGCGLFIMFDGNRLYARYEEPLSNTIIRVEEFYPKKYDLMVQTYNGGVSNKKIKPSFEKRRIAVFLNYLKQYENYVLDNKSKENKPKKK